MPLDLELDSLAIEPDSTASSPHAGAPPVVANRPTDLHEACISGDHLSVHFLLATGADPGRIGAAGWRPLHLAAAQGDARVVALLLAAGARPDRPSRHERGYGGTTALHVAAAVASEPIVEALLGAGADPEARDDAGFTPLHIAASVGARAIVKALVLAGADADALVADTSALELATRGGHRATAALLQQIVRSRRC